VFEVLRENGVDPADCSLDADTAPIRLHHHPTGSKFNFVDHGDNWEINFEVMDGPHDSYSEVESWNSVLAELDEWASEVKYVNEHADLWAELEATPRVLAAAQAADASNAPFTADEQAEIFKRIDEITEAAQEKFALTDEQSAAVNETLHEVKEAVTRVGRKDWIMLANGALLSLILNDLVPAQAVRGIISMLVTGIGHIFGIGGLPPVIGS
jgi:hypothetical protein